MKKLILSALFLLFIFDLNAKIIYVEPVQNAKYVSINNNIIIGFDEIIQSSNLNSLISVTGALSGVHSGEIIFTADRKKLIFKPNQPFAFNEQIEVKLIGLKTSSVSNNKLTYTFQTQVSKQKVDYNKIMAEESGNLSENNYAYSDNSSAIPPLTVTISNNPTPGHLFFTSTVVSPYAPYLIIANNDGSPYYARELTVQAQDFNRQPSGLMTYFNGTKYYGEGPQYNVIDSFYCGNGYDTDFHDLAVLNNGHALLMSYDPEEIDMSQIVPGGDPYAIVTGLIVQEIDENKNVVFQWRSWDHFNIVDAIFVNLTASTIDCVHGNAATYDTDGNILLSSRHLSEITKINRATGAIVWRFGGVHNQFTFPNDTIPNRYQHHIRRIANGNITFFDNGNFRTPSFSRAVEYNLDEVNKIATLVWQYIHTPVIYGPNRGSVQRLRNGNTLIGWGGTNPTMTEVTPSGTIALEMSLPTNIISYRAFRDEVHITLNVKLAIEGYYNSQTNRLNKKDTVRAYIRNAISPYTIMDSSKSIIDSLTFTGNFRFYNAPGGSYYITIKHRNGLETWSKAGGESMTFEGVYLYDFTSSSTQAYGSNLVLKGSKYCIYSGDVNQNGTINAADQGLVDNDVLNFASGYVSTDVDGNNVLNALDLGIVDNNVYNFISKKTPP